MSGTKNVVIQQNNGTDYDKLHPETVDSKVNLTGDNVSAWGNTLKDALLKINNRLVSTEDNQWIIGDIRVTTKNDLGNKWLRCDGNSYDTSAYPELAKNTSVQGFPFGTGNLKVITIPGNNSFKAANGNWGDNTQAVEVNGYYIRTSEINLNISQKKVSFTIYYSTDFENWNDNKIEVQWPDLRGDDTYRTLLVGYENRYWYFSFIFNSYAGFIYSSDIKSKSWTLIKTSCYCNWSGQLFYYNNQWMFWGYLWNSSDNEYVLTKVYSNSIDFSSFNTVIMNHSGVDQAGTPDCWSYNFGSVVYQIAESVDRDSDGGYDYGGVNLYSFNIGSNTASYFSLCTRSYSIQQFLKNNNGLFIYKKYYHRNSGTSYYVITLDGTNISSLPSEEQCYNKTDYPSFINKDGKFCLYYNSGKSIQISNSPTLSSPSSQSSSSWASEINGEVTAFLETDSGVFFENSGGTIFGKVSFGGVLPSYSPESTSTTKLNAFIKALD